MFASSVPIEGLHYVQLIPFGGIYFWLVILAALVVQTILVEMDYSVPSFFVPLVALVVLQVFGDTDVLGFIWKHPLLTISSVVLYFMIGIATSFIQWTWYCNNQRSAYDAAKSQWAEECKRIGNSPHKEWHQFYQRGDMGLAWERRLESHYNYNRCNGSVADKFPDLEMTLEEIKGGEGPRFDKHKAKCLSWATTWTSTFFWAIINDPVRKLIVEIVLYLKSWYVAIAKKSFQGTANDFCSPSLFCDPIQTTQHKPPVGPDGKLF